jgi:hypothetical protein
MGETLQNHYRRGKRNNAAPMDAMHAAPKLHVPDFISPLAHKQKAVVTRVIDYCQHNTSVAVENWFSLF